MVFLTNQTVFTFNKKHQKQTMFYLRCYIQTFLQFDRAERVTFVVFLLQFPADLEISAVLSTIYFFSHKINKLFFAQTS